MVTVARRKNTAGNDQSGLRAARSGVSETDGPDEGEAPAESAPDVFAAPESPGAAFLAKLFPKLPPPAAFAQTRAGILSSWMMGARESAVTIGFMSRSAREGVTTVVAGLARSLGADEPGKVLVIDTGAGRRRVADLLRAGKATAGVQSIARGKSNLPASMVRDIKHGVDIVTLADRGCVTGSATKARSIIDRLAPRYDVVMIDAGAWSNGQALHWLAASQYRVLVLDARKTTREVLEFEREQLAHTGIKPDAAILNRRVYPIPRALYWLVR